MSWYFLKQSNVAQRDDFLKIALKERRNLSIPNVDLNNKSEKAAHDKMVALVEQMLDAKKHLQAARTDKDKNYYEDKCKNLDRQIDKTVYELYQLTPDEIKIVENS